MLWMFVNFYVISFTLRPWRVLRALARAGAFASLAGHRRQALWQAAGVETLPPLLHNRPERIAAAVEEIAALATLVLVGHAQQRLKLALDERQRFLAGETAVAEAAERVVEEQQAGHGPVVVRPCSGCPPPS